eukprot:CAMPEP_0184665926 /NCGR_PEP_ID=MMETSP0308-20130426/59333_1 /TAXON_ID=38269 /ORGANISM="Gloeochaete witrockiana, Strain SAG 46.84" /LENGTH=813 /DNA_ID=CAMNT_0027110233 /DNA_START=23 /DNA_END=2464 /DNA_ORIENTATION=-
MMIRSQQASPANLNRPPSKVSTLQTLASGSQFGGFDALKKAVENYQKADTEIKLREERATERAKSLEQQVKTLQSTQRSLEQEKSALCAQIRSEKENIKRLEGSLTTLSEKFDLVRHSASRFEDALNKGESATVSLTKTLSQVQDHLTKCRTERDAFEADVVKKNGAIRDFEQQIHLLELESKAAQGKEAELQAELAAAGLKYAELYTCCDARSKDLDAKSKECIEVQNLLNATIEDLRGQYRAIQEQEHQAREELAKIVQLLENEKCKHLGEKSRLENSINEQIMKFEESERNLAISNERANRLLADLDVARKEILVKDCDISECKQRILDIISERDQTLEKLGATELEKKCKEAELEAAKTEHDLQCGMILTLENTAGDLRQQILDLQRIVQEGVSTLESERADAAKIQNGLLSLQMLKDKADAQILSLESSLSEAKAELHAKETEFASEYEKMCNKLNEERDSAERSWIARLREQAREAKDAIAKNAMECQMYQAQQEQKHMEEMSALHDQNNEKIVVMEIELQAKRESLISIKTKHGEELAAVKDSHRMEVERLTLEKEEELSSIRAEMASQKRKLEASRSPPVTLQDTLSQFAANEGASFSKTPAASIPMIPSKPQPKRRRASAPEQGSNPNSAFKSSAEGYDSNVVRRLHEEKEYSSQFVPKEAEETPNKIPRLSETKAKTLLACREEGEVPTAHQSTIDIKSLSVLEQQLGAFCLKGLQEKESMSVHNDQDEANGTEEKDSEHLRRKSNVHSKGASKRCQKRANGALSASSKTTGNASSAKMAIKVGGVKPKSVCKDMFDDWGFDE